MCASVHQGIEFWKTLKEPMSRTHAQRRKEIKLAPQLEDCRNNHARIWAFKSTWLLSTALSLSGPWLKLGFANTFVRTVWKARRAHIRIPGVCAELEDHPLTILKSVLLTGDAAAPPTPTSLYHLLEQGRMAKLGSPGPANWAPG